MIRKEGKARWVYTCEPCGYTSPASPDLLRAKEWSLRHNRGNFFTHLGQAFAEAAKPLAEFIELVGTVVNAEHSKDDYVLVPPPKNLPHDPSLLRDRRKWGGR
jgi:hypothetical protein